MKHYKPTDISFDGDLNESNFKEYSYLLASAGNIDKSKSKQGGKYSNYKMNERFNTKINSERNRKENDGEFKEGITSANFLSAKDQDYSTKASDIIRITTSTNKMLTSHNYENDITYESDDEDNAYAETIFNEFQSQSFNYLS